MMLDTDSFSVDYELVHLKIEEIYLERVKKPWTNVNNWYKKSNKEKENEQFDSALKQRERDSYSTNLSILKISSYSNWNLFRDAKILRTREIMTLFKL